jgi:hypothetical protein
MIPIVVSTIDSTQPHVNVFVTSVSEYCPEVDLLLYSVKGTNFGDVYNQVMSLAFHNHDEIIIANDDIVLRPDTYKTLLEDVEFIKTKTDKVGFVAARADIVRPHQSIQSEIPKDIYMSPVISPLFAYISKEAFSDAQFPPLNWYSDDVMCQDLNNLGYKHFISRSYVHHVGSQTVGFNFDQLTEDAKPWIKENRNKYYREWFK